MVMGIALNNLLIGFWTLFIILDPFLGLAVFVTLTKGMKKSQKIKQAFIAVFIAFILLFFFLFFGTGLLGILGINMSSFRVAGGIVLLILGIQSVLGLEFAKKDQKRKVLAVIIGTPILCGPGAITTTIILSQQYGKMIAFLAITFAIAITWLILSFSDKISNLLGARVIEVISRIFGLFLAALAAEMIKTGIIEMIMAF